MSDYQSKYEKYVKDTRISCQYGVKCYQKNPIHQEKYKHPPKKNANTHSANVSSRKRKLSENSNEGKEKIRKTPELQDHTLGKEHNDDISIKDNKEIEEPKEIENKEDNKPPEENVSKTKALPKLPEKFDVKKFIKSKFLVEMPPDFYQFWDFCKQLNSEHPEHAFSDVGLELVGPFDVLAGKFYGKEDKPESEYLCHWRYYYDPPEMQTVIKGYNKTGFHIGYFRDDPNELPSLVVSNYGTKEGILNKMGDNLFAAVYIYLEEFKATCDPFKKLLVDKLLNRIKKEAKKLNYNLGKITPKIRARQNKTVAQTLNKVGLVVPYNRKTELGYRELAVNNKTLQKQLDNIRSAAPEQRNKFLSDLQPVLNNATIAIDECDFGTGIELGWDIIAHGVDSLNFTALRFLKQCYELLNRNVFAKIAEAHLNNRKKGCNLSII